MEIPEAPATAGPLLRGLAAALLLAAATLSPGPAAAQVASQSVNMVSGIQWPGGDPFLQRQNEPSVAVSSRNPRHLLAGANDYRAVDLPFSTPNAPETGDAWLGVFKSFDGGITWRSTLLPGYPQQVPRTGPLSTFTTAADPVVRTGTNGLFYYSGIAFNRDTKDGVVFVARFMDLNNKENGDPASNSDPIRYIDTKVIDSAAPSAPFIDKPWIAVDKPRLLDGVCHLTVPQPLPGNPNATVSQTVPAGSVYAAWTEVSGTGSALTTNVFFSSSRDCGGTWSRPVKLNGTNKVNQGASIAIDPATGVIYVVWRRLASGSQTDAIMMTRSFRGLLFPAPSVVVSLPAYNAVNPTAPSFFDQGTTEDSFRTTAYPTIGIDRRPDAGSEDDDEPDTPTFRGKVFVAWSQRGIGPNGDARVVLSVSTNGGSTWSAPMPVDNSSLTDDTGHVFSRGHQFMPQMTVTADKITIIYYDARFDHTFGLFSPWNGWNNPLLPDPVTGRLYLETRDLRGELFNPGGPAGLAMVFTPFFVETGMTQWRHTIDLRFAQADAAVSPVFSSSRLSQYSFGTRGDETGTISFLQQLQINPPNLKLFQQGSVPFIGDYIDVTGPTFLPPKAPGRRWRFNSLPGTSPVFLASWTSNQDVRPPLNGDWTDYTPAGSTTTSVPSVFNPALQRPTCVFGQEGMRNQNIYAARISQGLAVTSVQNAKPLSTTIQRDLALSVENLTPFERTFRLTIAGQPAGGRASFVPAPNPLPNPLPAATTTLDVTIPANSSVARSVYALSTDPHAPIEVDVAEVNGAPGGPLKTNGLTGFIIFNTDPSAPTLIDPDNTSAPSVTTVEIYNPNVSNPNVSNPNVSNPNVSNPNVSNPNVSNPNVSNPNVSNPNVSNADLANPNVSNPNVSNPNVSNPNVSNPNVSNPNVSNAPVSDATYTVTNTGNTAATYRIELVGTAPAGTPLQLIITKPYANPASLNCVLFEQQHNVPVANVVNPTIVIPGSPPASGITDPSDGNVTFVLGPGESILVTIRAPVDGPTLTSIIPYLVPVVVAHAPNTNDLTNTLPYAAPQPAVNPAITEYPLPMAGLITECPLPTVGSAPDGIAAGPDGALWFTENGFSGNRIGRITTAGALTEYPLPTVGSAPIGIAAGPDGALWFTEYNGNKIGRVTTAGAFTEYPVPTAGSAPVAIVAGPDGALWFTEYNGNQIGRVTATGAITEYPLPTAGSGPDGIAAGLDGALWFTEVYSDRIGRITTAGAITEYPLPTAGSSPVAIAAGPDGAFWFAEYGGNRIGRITTAGAITEYPLPTAGSWPVGITAGPDGALWFTERNGDRIGRITTAGAITEYPLPTAASVPFGIVAGSDGALWFTELDGNRIGRIAMAGSGPAGIAAGPDGALWFTEADGNRIGRITTAGAITDYPVPTAGSGAVGIAAGPDGNLWFTEYITDQIGRITTAGVITEFPLTAGSKPEGITAGQDGDLWFTEPNRDRIGRITTAGVITEFPLTAGSRPEGITAGQDGALWFTEYDGSKIGRITTAGVITEFPLAAGSGPTFIAAGLDGNLWFTEYITDQIGRITTAGVITEYPLPAGSVASWIAAGPDGALWFTDRTGDQIGRITTAGVITEYPLPAGSGPEGIAAGPNGALWFTENVGNRIGQLR